MKILAIRIRNLASLEGTTEIDFRQEPLCSAGIYAITGPTGAGKSTILDALCLALYSKTPRYVQARESGIEVEDVQGNKIGQNDVRGILRDGTADGFAEVDFVGVDGDNYRARWSVRRARNKVEGALQAAEIGLKNLSKNADIGGRKTDLLPEIERLVGLNFEQFRRSVLLPQGDFTAFLKADKDEKSSLLEKLTGTEVYSEISKRVFERHREESQKLKDLNLRREGIETLTAEEVHALTLRKGDLEKSLKEYDGTLALLNRELVWHERLAFIKGECDHAALLLEKAIEERDNARDRRQKLYQAEQVQSARSWFDNRTESGNQRILKERILKGIDDEICSVQSRKESMQHQLREAEEAMKTRTKERDEARPLLEQARELDIQLREKGEQLRKAEEEHLGATKKRDDYAQQQFQKEREAEGLMLQIRQLEDWKNRNNDRKPIAENEALIVSKLSDGRGYLADLKAVLEETEKVQLELGNLEGEKKKLEAEYGEGEVRLNDVRSKVEEESKSLSSVSIEALEARKGKTDLEVEELIAALGQWNLLYTSILEHDKVRSESQYSHKALADKDDELKKLSSSLDRVKAQRDASSRMLQIAQQAVSKDVEALRSQLIAGEDCPVCGSREHPYVTGGSQLHDVLEKQKAEHEQNESAYATCLEQHHVLKGTCDQLQRQLFRLQEEMSQTKERISALQDSWTAMSVQNDCLSVEAGQKEEWLQRRLKDMRTTQGELQALIQSYYRNKQALEVQNNQREQLEKNQAVLVNQIKDAERTLRSLNDKKEVNANNLGRLHAELQDIESQLSPYFSSDGWFENWKASSDSFLARIRDFASQWKQKADQLENISKSHSLLNTGIEGMRESLQHLTADADQREESRDKIRDSFDGLKKQRSGILDGKDVQEAESELRLAVEAAARLCEERRESGIQLEVDFQRLLERKAQEQNSLAAFIKQGEECSEQISKWLFVYNSRNTELLREEAVEELLLLSQEWIESERMALRAIDDAVTRAGSIAEERKLAYKNHERERLSERTREDLIHLTEEQKSTAAQVRDECTSIGIALRQDQDNRHKISDLLGLIESQSQSVDQWGKLNDIIGSGDGKKFRQIAQEYTLDVLLTYANVHLNVLSRRYLVQRIPNTLGLQVVDQDMGDEVRTVFSLSGGESFLVSLALALGLASLSSNKMKVESLFIDEGFGSLDPQTLNVAMDALERLHNQGRKVGVISHVQEMTERIPVQIKVSKESSGRSVLALV